MSREKVLAKNTAILAIGTFLPKVSTYFTLPILTGILTKEEYGTYDLVTVLVSLILPAATLQIQTALFRFLIEIREDEKEVKKIVSTGSSFIIIVSILALIILNIVMNQISFVTRLFISGYFFADILVNGLRQVARGLTRNLDYSLSAFISAACKILFIFLFVGGMKKGINGAVCALMISSLASFIFLFFKIKAYKLLSFRSTSFDTLKLLLSYSWPMVPNNMSMWAMRLSNRLIITFFMGAAQNAVYAVATKIPNLLTMAQSTFSMAWQENASLYSKDEDIEEYYSKMYRTMFDIMAGFLAMLICATPILFALLIKGDYNEAYNQVPILFFSMFFFVMSTFLGGIYVAYKKTKSVGLTTIYAAIINVVLDVLLIKAIGLYAASISTLISYVLLYLFRAVDIKKLVHLEIDYRHVALVLAILFAESIFCFMQNKWLNILNFIIGILLFVVLNKDLIIKGFEMIRGFLKKSKTEQDSD